MFFVVARFRNTTKSHESRKGDAMAGFTWCREFFSQWKCTTFKTNFLWKWPAYGVLTSSLWVEIALDTASRLAYSCRSGLFGSGRRVDPDCGTSADRCSTCCPRRARGSVCSFPALSARRKSLPTKKNQKIRVETQHRNFFLLTFVSESRIR